MGKGTMESFDFHGRTVAYVRAGEGPPVVFLHNGGSSHTIWRHQLSHLARSHEVFGVDPPGYGASMAPAGGWALANYVDFLDAFVADVAGAPVHLVGNCMGSAISLAFAQRDHDAVRTLVLVNPLTGATLSTGWLGGLPWLRRRAPGLTRALSEAVSRPRLPRIAGELALRFQLGQAGSRTGLHRDPELLACYARPGQMRALAGIIDDPVGYRELDDIPVEPLPPTCTIWGTRNRVLSANAGRKLNERLRPERAEFLERAGHLPMLEEPARVSDIVERFVDEHERAAVSASATESGSR